MPDVTKFPPGGKDLLEQANHGVLFVGGMEIVDQTIRARLANTLRKRLLGTNEILIPLDIRFLIERAIKEHRLPNKA